MADFLEHLADFAVAAFDEDHFVPGIVGVAEEAEASGGGHARAVERRTVSWEGASGSVGFLRARTESGTYLRVAVDHEPWRSWPIADSEGLPLTLTR